MIQITSITFLIFLAAVIINAIYDYQRTRDDYLSAKNEMMDYDLNVIVKEAKSADFSAWLFKYIRQHRDAALISVDNAESMLDDEESAMLDDIMIRGGFDAGLFRSACIKTRIAYYRTGDNVNTFGLQAVLTARCIHIISIAIDGNLTS